MSNNVDTWSIKLIQRLYAVQKNKTSRIIETTFNQKLKNKYTFFAVISKNQYIFCSRKLLIKYNR